MTPASAPCAGGASCCATEGWSSGMFWENIGLALKEFATNRMRTFLSVLGIVIGIGSVIAITTLGRSATVSVQEQVSQAGMGTITVFPGRDSDKEVRRLFTAGL